MIQEAARIPLKPDYCVHFVDRSYVMIGSSQKEMLNFDREDVMNTSIYDFLPRTISDPAKTAIDNTFNTGMPLWFAYSLNDYAFLCLFERINPNIVAVHEVLDNLAKRCKLKKFLLAASDNFNRELYRKDMGD